MLKSLVAAMQAEGLNYRASRHVFERALLAHALEASGWNQLKAAGELGLHPKTFRRKILELDIDATGKKRTNR